MSCICGGCPFIALCSPDTNLLSCTRSEDAAVSPQPAHEPVKCEDDVKPPVNSRPFPTDIRSHAQQLSHEIDQALSSINSCFHSFVPIDDFKSLAISAQVLAFKVQQCHTPPESFAIKLDSLIDAQKQNRAAIMSIQKQIADSARSMAQGEPMARQEHRALAKKKSPVEIAPSDPVYGVLVNAFPITKYTSMERKLVSHLQFHNPGIRVLTAGWYRHPDRPGQKFATLRVTVETDVMMKHLLNKGIFWGKYRYKVFKYHHHLHHENADPLPTSDFIRA